MALPAPGPPKVLLAHVLPVHVSFHESSPRSYTSLMSLCYLQPKIPETGSRRRATLDGRKSTSARGNGVCRGTEVEKACAETQREK